ncbi:hypothetical protein O181_000706 [Austropuccinia psidii MF-1]|uniref:Uncharacterized protein n=1 Tax=Austropuccinia psidii MF-1 TaxID=1389203 RepID=A0A9Q3GBT4_9BASI|nr:hypothetical protein [Austropuccinia psidii MF-1]
MGLQFNYGPNQKWWTSLSILERPPFLWIWAGLNNPGHMDHISHQHHPWPPVIPFKIGPRESKWPWGTSISPTARRLWAVKIKIDLNGQNFKFEEKFHYMERTKMTSKGHFGHRTSRFMGKRPLLKVHMEEFGATKGLKQLWTTLRGWLALI